jgi:putative sigma-54 modulation protein
VQVIMSGRGVALTPALKALVERKVGRLTRVLPDVSTVRVTCGSEKFRRTVRLTVKDRRHLFATAATADDLGAAIDEAIETLRRQVRVARDRRRRPPGRPRGVATAAESAEAREPTTAAPVVRRLVAKPMSVEEAIMQLGLGDDQFLVFQNAESREVNVLYRRRDGGLALIEPVA